MNFMFEWQEQYLTSERSERVRYCSSVASVTSVAVISLDQMHATIRPYTALRHRLIKK